MSEPSPAAGPASAPSLTAAPLNAPSPAPSPMSTAVAVPVNNPSSAPSPQHESQLPTAPTIGQAGDAPSRAHAQQYQPHAPASAPSPQPPPPPIQHASPSTELAQAPRPMEQLHHYQTSSNETQQSSTSITTTTTTAVSTLPSPLHPPEQPHAYQIFPHNGYQDQSLSLRPGNSATLPSSTTVLPQTSTSLPPIQYIDHAQQQQQQAQYQQALQRAQHTNGPSPSQIPLPIMGTLQMNVTPVPVPDPNQGMNQYYSPVPGTVTTADAFQLGREPNRLLSGGRAKKEVKRRTKTGCLTCRKRRIKCDERHPVCRNCEKSKRECLGYDPVFRSQTTTGGTTLHPAPPSQSPSLSGLSPIQSPQYAAQHIILQQTPPPLQPVQSLQQPLQVHNHIQQTQTVRQHQQAPFDQRVLQTPPATATGPPLSSHQQFPPSLPPLPLAQTFDHTHPENIKALADAAAADPPKRPPANMLGVQELHMRRVRIHDLLSIRGYISPLPPETDVSPSRIEEIKMVYMSYANGIDKFLECHWYEMRGLTYLLESRSLLSQYSALLDGFNDRNIHDPNVLAQVESREASVIWNTFTLCRSAHARALSDDGSTTSSHTDPELLYAVKRLFVIETMLTGAHLDTNPVDLSNYPESDPAYRQPGLGGQIKVRELEFWQSIGRFLTYPGDDDPHDDTAQREKEAALLTSRGLLDTFENRDVIYSIAIARHIAKFQPGKIKTVPTTADERDASSKLYVACRFLEDESRGKGTNQVIKRVAGMIVKYWEDPILMM